MTETRPLPGLSEDIPDYVNREYQQHCGYAHPHTNESCQSKRPGSIARLPRGTPRGTYCLLDPFEHSDQRRRSNSPPIYFDTSSLRISLERRL